MILAVFYGVLAWFDLASRQNVGFLEGLIFLAVNLFAAPFFLAMVVAGIGHALRLFALFTIKDEV